MIAKLISVSSALSAMQYVQATSPVPTPLCPSYYEWSNPGAYCLDDGSLYQCDYAGMVPAYMIDSCSGWGTACISNVPYHADYCERGNNNGNSNKYVPFLDEFEAPQYGFAVRGQNDLILYGVMSHAECAYECYQKDWCKSFEMADFDSENRCILSGATSPVFAPDVYEHGTWTLYIKKTWVPVPVFPPSPQPGTGRQCEKPEWTGGSYCTGNFGDFKGKDLGFQLCYPNFPQPVPYLLPGYESVEETCNRWESSICGTALTNFVNSCCPHKYMTSEFASMVSICASTDLK